MAGVSFRAGRPLAEPCCENWVRCPGRVPWALVLLRRTVFRRAGTMLTSSLRAVNQTHDIALPHRRYGRAWHPRRVQTPGGRRSLLPPDGAGLPAAER